MTTEKTPSPSRRLSARLEPFDSYWQAPDDVEKGYTSFVQYYKVNFLPHVPERRDALYRLIRATGREKAGRGEAEDRRRCRGHT